MFGFFPGFDWGAWNDYSQTPAPSKAVDCEGCEFIHDKMKDWKCACECHLLSVSGNKTSSLEEEEDTDYVCGSSSD